LSDADHRLQLAEERVRNRQEQVEAARRSLVESKGSHEAAIALHRQLHKELADAAATAAGIEAPATSPEPAPAGAQAARRAAEHARRAAASASSSLAAMRTRREFLEEQQARDEAAAAAAAAIPAVEADLTALAQLEAELGAIDALGRHEGLKLRDVIVAEPGYEAILEA